MTTQNRPNLIFQPHAYQDFQRGVNKLADAIAPTLGPLPRNVAIQPSDRNAMPEVLDNGATIARRIIQLPDRSEDMGAMYLRQLLWTIHENIGDGTATAAVLFRAIYNQALRFIAAGGNAMVLRRQLDCLIPRVTAELDNMTTLVSEQDAFTRIAHHICHDQELAHKVGEVFDVVGPYGAIDIQTSHTFSDECHYIQGAHWKSTPLISELLSQKYQQEDQLITPHILITDMELTEPGQIVHILKAAIQAKAQSLLIVAFGISEQAAAVLRANQRPDRIKVSLMKVPGVTTEERMSILEDIALRTGAKPLLSITQDAIEHVTSAHFGQARNVWVSHSHFGIMGGRGDAQNLRRLIHHLRQKCVQTNDLQEQGKLQKRLGVLLGGTAVLRISGLNEIETKRRKQLAERTVNAMRGVLKNGVVPGGGLALLRLAHKLKQTKFKFATEEERAAISILASALEAPLRVLSCNAGYEAGYVLSKIEAKQFKQAFDMLEGQLVDFKKHAMFDSAETVRHVLTSTIRAASLSLTIDVLLHHDQPEIANMP